MDQPPPMSSSACTRPPQPGDNIQGTFCAPHNACAAGDTTLADTTPTDHRGPFTTRTSPETGPTIHTRRAAALGNPWCSICPLRQHRWPLTSLRSSARSAAFARFSCRDRLVARFVHRQHLPQPDGRGGLSAVSGAERETFRRYVAWLGRTDRPAATRVCTAGLRPARHSPEPREAFDASTKCRSCRSPVNPCNGQRTQARAAGPLPYIRRKDLPARTLGSPGDRRPHRARFGVFHSELRPHRRRGRQLDAAPQVGRVDCLT
jgi:hypothetical protein